MPAMAPYCYGMATGMVTTGLSMITNGLCENENNRKQSFFTSEENDFKILDDERYNKVYVSPDQIVNTLEGIYVDTGVPWLIDVDDLSSDEFGPYVIIRNFHDNDCYSRNQEFLSK